MRVYIAAPLHDAEDKARNTLLAARLRADGHTVYLPQEHGVWEEVLDQFHGDGKAARSYLAKSDLFAMKHSDCCIAYMEREKGPSEGMLWEMGWYTGINKPVILYNPNGFWDYNPMPETHSTVFTDLEKLLQYIKEETFV